MPTVVKHTGKAGLLLLLLLCNWFNLTGNIPIPLENSTSLLLQELNSIFLSIVIEALPFVLVGIFVSAFIQTFVSPELIQKLIPRHRLWGIIVSSLLGIIFPLCECGMVPITRRLVAKGVPVSMAVSFMLAAPVINPLVGLSTYLAFNSSPYMAGYRLLGTFISTIVVAYLLGGNSRPNSVLSGIGHHSYCGHDHDQNCNHKHGLLAKLNAMSAHACEEFFDMGRFLLIGSFLAALCQGFIPRTALLAFGQDSFLSVLSMMSFAFVISVCSQADAFIAAPFLTSFTPGAVTAFLILGPMLDIKNTLMLFSGFKPWFVMKLILLIVCMVFAVSMSINIFPQVWTVIIGG